MMGADSPVVVERVKLGSQGLELSALGLGYMGMTGTYGPAKDEAEMIKLIHHAVDVGVTFLDTADIYGPFTNKILVGKAIKEIRHKVQIATKCGFDIDANGILCVRGDPAHVRACCEGNLKRLGVDCIELFYQHRMDPNVAIEETVAEMKKLVEEGKIKYIGLSEAPADVICRAHAVHPITAVQTEWSLWMCHVEDDVIPTCRELGIGFVPYSPLGRGFFAGAEVQSAGDIRQHFIPFFKPENLEKNKKLLAQVAKIAKEKKCTTNQLALAWVISKGAPITLPIPGTTKLANLKSNIGALDVRLSPEEMQSLEDAVPADEVAGSRYAQISREEQTKLIKDVLGWQENATKQ